MGPELSIIELWLALICFDYRKLNFIGKKFYVLIMFKALPQYLFVPNLSIDEINNSETEYLYGSDIKLQKGRSYWERILSERHVIGRGYMFHQRLVFFALIQATSC
jgi:hypothetical protein